MGLPLNTYLYMQICLKKLHLTMPSRHICRETVLKLLNSWGEHPTNDGVPHQLSGILMRGGNFAQVEAGYVVLSKGSYIILLHGYSRVEACIEWIMRQLYKEKYKVPWFGSDSPPISRETALNDPRACWFIKLYNQGPCIWISASSDSLLLV